MRMIIWLGEHAMHAKPVFACNLADRFQYPLFGCADDGDGGPAAALGQRADDLDAIHRIKVHVECDVAGVPVVEQPQEGLDVACRAYAEAIMFGNGRDQLATGGVVVEHQQGAAMARQVGAGLYAVGGGHGGLR